MPAATSFSEFLQRIRRGDESAAAELVHRYEPLIRREVRMRLTDPALYRLVDSADICQSVLASFFVRAAAGQYELDRPDDLRKLLVVMARNKLASRARQVRTRCVENSRPATGAGERLEVQYDRHPGPEQVVLNRDLLRQVLGELPDEERHLADLRAQGLTWPAISGAVGGTAEGRRKQLARALDRVLRDLGLEDES